MTLNLYQLSQSSDNDYDTYYSCVVAAESEEAARRIHPGGGDYEWSESERAWRYPGRSAYSARSWAAPTDVSVELIGVASEDQVEGLIIASFNAG
jgi:hypothetical protein